ncbi:FHA domain-containing serine/threonine-protein kinase [Haloarchaeobius amylolyticus]|uniref:FHA domain-containing serine/threonine-protein kinase n=1 Tax=Haloarchaeobius amylolyticus TaxID=1198296 RepID=UPI0022717D88|nr:FHA domain-containing serine/threonine-protein kinase [Haloarchaeobius amylolyticus]
MMWEPDAGEVLNSRYELVERIGDGGFSVVWRARNDRGDVVAIKHPNPNAGKSQQAIEKYFQRELNSLQAIEQAGGHPNIMSLHETFTEKGTEFMAVEYVDGQLMEELAGMGDHSQVVDIGIQTCDIFSHIHDLELVYRDLKPDNIMITDSGRVVLIDFNTARHRARCGECGQTINFDNLDSDHCPNCNEELDSGTVIRAGARGQSKYKPPEVANAVGRQGPWSDVYSIGKLLNFLLLGFVRPLPGRNPQEDHDDCPNFLGEIVVRATRHDPTERYRNASIMKRALENQTADPTLPEAVLENLETGRRLSVGPGDTIGRKNSSGPYSTIEIDDPTDEKLISRVHARFDISSEGWIIVDQSKNGTAIDDGSGWRPIIAEDSYDGPAEDAPPQYSVLEEGTKIGIHRPNDGEQFVFHT